MEKSAQTVTAVKLDTKTIKPAKVGRTRTASRKPDPRAVGTARGADDPLSAERVRYLTELIGGTALAEYIGVNRSQPTRWAKGDERPGPIAAPLLIDLEHVLARARLVWGGSAALIWLGSANAYLGGARPIDVLRLSGPAPVLEVLDAETWGGAA
ncbi:MAG: DUF2384 domain-containing protein [Rhodococcus sp.]|nr:DUF2384 domain-containing protein [Rhodococcus sp. (in: high G+C Gram-positive bacteria)]